MEGPDHSLQNEQLCLSYQSRKISHTLCSYHLLHNVHTWTPPSFESNFQRAWGQNTIWVSWMKRICIWGFNGESDQTFKKRFTSERSRQYDYLRDKEAVFSSANECSVRSSVFTNTGYQVDARWWRMLTQSLSTPSS